MASTLHQLKQGLIAGKCLLIATLSSVFCFAQKNAGSEECSVDYYQTQADSIKKLLTADGFELMRESSIKMESGYEMPVIVSLTKGTWYHMIFIGDPGSRLYEVRMYDWDEKQVVYQKKMWGDVDGNIISYSYIPSFSEFYMIKPVQIHKKKKKLCGYVMIFKKVK